jgi:hypothetical protein
MNNLIFLPIEISIDQTVFDFNTHSLPTFNGLWETKFLNDNDFFRPEIKNLCDQLPFEKITLIKYNRQSKDIPPHIDVQPFYVRGKDEYEHIKKNEPAGYRIVLSGSTDKLEVFDGKSWKIAALPTVPFAYVLNSTITKHRVIGEIGRMSVYFRGFLDENKHQEIIEKNLEKYDEYAIYDQ